MVEDIIIDIVGSFADGKTTLVRALSNELTLRHSEEKKRGITIRLGYAHFYIYKCKVCGKFSRTDKCEYCGGDTELFRRVSIIDSPGHKTLMTIMLSGAAFVDGAVLVISAAQKCPQPQTQEHLEALKILGIKNLVVAQTKVDIVGKERAKESYNEIKDFLSSNGFDNVDIIPVLAINNINVGEVVQRIAKFEIDRSNANTKDMSMLVVRSFDINKPGTKIEDLVGGVVGGAIRNGKIKVGDDIKILPGIKVKNTWKPLVTKVESIQSEFEQEKEAGPGLTIGVSTTLDPSLTRSDSMAGSVITSLDTNINVSNKITVKYFPLENKESSVFKKGIQKNEPVLVNVLSSKALGIVSYISNDKVDIIFENTVVPFFEKDKVIISRRVDNVWVLAGYGIIL